MADKSAISTYTEGDNRTLITKSHPSIHFTLDPKVSMTGAAAKGLNALIYAMQRQARYLSDNITEYHAKLGKGNTVIQMPISEFAKLIGVSSRNYQAFKKTIYEMGDMKVTWSNDEKGAAGNFGFHNLFVRAEVKDSGLEFVIPPESRELFINDKNVAVIDFVKVADCLSSKYSIFLHDIIEESMNGIADHSQVNVLQFTNEELRNALKVPYDLKAGEKTYSYPQPSRFIDKVLKPAVSEYNAAEMKYHILGYNHDRGRVWHFEIIPLSKTYIRRLELERPDELHALIMAMKQFGLNELNRSEFINSVVDEKDFEYLLYCKDVTLKNTRKVNGNAGGFFRTVFKNNSEQFNKIWEIACKEREIASVARRNKEQEHIDKQKEAHKTAYIKNRIDAFLKPIYENEDALDEFMEALMVHAINIKHPSSRKYKSEIESGRIPDATDPMVRMVAQSKLNITDNELNNYVEQQPIQINV
ncbi:replication initiation protein [Rheinheimera hassiensis]|uniref:replication initiation protein n=1 Tax=Rheinheimera hassiensis TaxID=1193627 RepID=UPI001F053DCD|nr:replication initiation protein [Rheinheimera hassiensis]